MSEKTRTVPQMLFHLIKRIAEMTPDTLVISPALLDEARLLASFGHEAALGGFTPAEYDAIDKMTDFFLASEETEHLDPKVLQGIAEKLKARGK